MVCYVSRHTTLINTVCPLGSNELCVFYPRALELYKNRITSQTIIGVNVMTITAVTVILIWRSTNQVKIIFIGFSIIKDFFCENDFDPIHWPPYKDDRSCSYGPSEPWEILFITYLFLLTLSFGGHNVGIHNVISKKKKKIITWVLSHWYEEKYVINSLFGSNKWSF
jgi:hypothetical protein